MSLNGPKASVRCVAVIRPESGVKPTWQDGSTDAVDPQRHFTTVNCRIAKGLFDNVVGDGEQFIRNC
jgi:hypothetical protein